MFFKMILTYTGIVKKFNISFFVSDIQLCEKPLYEFHLVEIFTT